MNLLVFGGRGVIGAAVAQCALDRGWTVTVTTRAAGPSDGKFNDRLRSLIVDPFSPELSDPFDQLGTPFDGVCWAQGANMNDSIYDVDLSAHEDLYRANVLFIMATLRKLIDRRLLAEPARLCIISSIWQNIARQNKLSYCVTKAALQGLLLSAATDLAKDGHLINAVLPGVLDTPMTRANLSSDQIEKVRSATKFDRLPALQSIVSTVLFLCSPDNLELTGQFVTADLGFSNVRFI